MIARYTVTAILFLLGSCGGGGGGGSSAPQPPAQSSDLTWDQGNWDNAEWQ